MAYVIDQDRCINCWWCRRACPTNTIHYFDQPNRKHWIDPEGCIDCDICAQVCPVDCITIDTAYVPDLVRFEEAKESARQWARKRRHEQVAAREAASLILQRMAPV
jgi:ferredoxin